MKHNQLKHFMLLFIVAITSPSFAQDTELESWINKIGNELIEMNDLARYSSEELPAGCSENSLMVDRFKIKEINDEAFILEIDHGRGVFCTTLRFNYIPKDDQFFLVFSEVKTKEIFGKTRLSVDPWVEKITDCN